MDDMGIFRTDVGPANVLEKLGIAAEREARFETAGGRVITRRIGYAIVHVESTSAPDIVVFGQPGDMALLGCRALEGLNLRVDVVAKKLVPAGLVPAAAA